MRTYNFTFYRRTSATNTSRVFECTAQGADIPTALQQAKQLLEDSTGSSIYSGYAVQRCYNSCNK